MEGLHDQQFEPIAGKPSKASNIGDIRLCTGHDLGVRRTVCIALREDIEDLVNDVDERDASFLLASDECLETPNRTLKARTCYQPAHSNTSCLASARNSSVGMHTGGLYLE